jgi:hypothetical protein
MTAPGTPGDGPARAAGRDSRGGQRFGHVMDRQGTAGPGGQPGTYRVRDEETGVAYAFGYADIVTEGLRSIRSGERVRFLIDPARPGHASYVIRLDLPDTAEYYQ